MSPKRRIWSRIKKPLISLVIIFAAAAVVVSVARMPAVEEELQPTDVAPVNVEVLTITPVPEIRDSLELPGTLEPRLVVDVPAELRGRIEKVFSVEGEEIEAGEMILELDTELLQVEFDRAKAQAEYDERNYERSKELLERGVLNKSQVEEAESRMVMSKANFDMASTNLNRSVIYAPVSGVLNEFIREQGEYVSPGDAVATIVAVDQVKVVVQIPERDVQFLKKGSRVPVVVEALNNLRVYGEITYISEVAESATRTTRIEITIDNPNRRFRSGLIVRAEIPRRVLRNVLMIPLSAVIPLENGRAVYIAADGEAQRRIVELGMIKGSQVQILSGLSPGEQLIVSGHRLVGPGQKISVVSSES